jgi:hypothetical protein
MVRKTQKPRNERLIRRVEISSVRTRVSTYASHPRGSDPVIETKCSLNLVGILDEAVRDVVDIEIHLYPSDDSRVGTARPASVGAIVDFHPHLQLVVSFLPADFDRLWTTALTGHLKYARLVFTTPHRNTSLVTSVSFSSKPEE